MLGKNNRPSFKVTDAILGVTAEYPALIAILRTDSMWLRVYASTRQRRQN